MLAAALVFVAPLTLVPSHPHTLAPSSVAHRAAVKLMPPPLNPVAAGHPLSPPGKPVVIELFLDLICPFSSKMYKTVYDEVRMSPLYLPCISRLVHPTLTVALLYPNPRVRGEA